MTRQELAAKIDHTILKADATFDEIRSTIEYAKKEKTASVCLNPAYVSLAADILKDTDTVVCTVIGFPLGANSTYTKAKEAKNAYLHGARELDMVINISALKSKNYDYVKNDITAVVEATPAIVKVIIETCYLTDDEISTACRLAAEGGAHFVKTSTGFGPAGATAKHIRLMRSAVPDGIQIKAAGGIRTLKDAKAMLKAGADRIGMSSTEAVLSELDAENAAKTKPKQATPKKKAPAKGTKAKTTNK